MNSRRFNRSNCIRSTPARAEKNGHSHLSDEIPNANQYWQWWERSGGVLRGGRALARICELDSGQSFVDVALVIVARTDLRDTREFLLQALENLLENQKCTVTNGLIPRQPPFAE
jgi:hypothetical protein